MAFRRVNFQCGRSYQKKIYEDPKIHLKSKQGQNVSKGPLPFDIDILYCSAFEKNMPRS